MAERDDENLRTCCCPPDIAAVFQPQFFKALCEPSRIRLLVRLAQRREPSTVTEMAECCPTCVSVVSRHLAMLRDAGILDAQRRGKEVYYRVDYSKLVATLRSIADAVEACCPSDDGEREDGHNQQPT